MLKFFLELLETLIQPLIHIKPFFLEALKGEKMLKGSLAKHSDGFPFHLRHWHIRLQK